MKKTLAALLILLCTASCATQQFRTGQNNTKSLPRKYESSQQFFVYGIGQTKEVDTSNVCNGKKPTQVSNTLSPLDAVIGLVQRVLIIVEIYSPRTTAITC